MQNVRPCVITLAGYHLRRPKTEGERAMERHRALRRAKAIERAQREADAAAVLRALRPDGGAE